MSALGLVGDGSTSSGPVPPPPQKYLPSVLPKEQLVSRLFPLPYPEFPGRTDLLRQHPSLLTLFQSLSISSVHRFIFLKIKINVILFVNDLLTFVSPL